MTPSTIIWAIVLLASAFVPYDSTYLNTVRPHETNVINVELPSGPLSIDVWATDNEVISCRVLDANTYQVISKDDNVKRCIYGSNTDHGNITYIAIVNDGDKAIDTRIWVRSVKK